MINIWAKNQTHRSGSQGSHGAAGKNGRCGVEVPHIRAGVIGALDVVGVVFRRTRTHVQPKHRHDHALDIDAHLAVSQ